MQEEYENRHKGSCRRSMRASAAALCHRTTRRMASTLIVKVNPEAIDDDVLRTHAVPLLARGCTVAIPTETVYGLAANAYNPEAVRRIFLAKGRPSDNPLIVHVSSMEQVRSLVHPDAFPVPGSLVKKLTDKFWPGPLTLLFPKSDRVPDAVTAGLPTIAVRMPAHPVARRIIELSGLPLAAPSANRSGRPSPTTAGHVYHDLGYRDGAPVSTMEKKFLGEEVEQRAALAQEDVLQCIVDGGACDYGVESTVVNVNGSSGPVVLRPGGVTLEQLREVVPDMRVFRSTIDSGSDTMNEEQAALQAQPPTPGLKYTHYSPSAHVCLVAPPGSEEESRRVEQEIRRLLDEHLAAGEKVGLIHTQERFTYVCEYEGRAEVIEVGDSTQPELIARNLFAALREFDDRDVKFVIMEGISEERSGMAVMNRARKAATSTISAAALS